MRIQNTFSYISGTYVLLVLLVLLVFFTFFLLIIKFSKIYIITVHKQITAVRKSTFCFGTVVSGVQYSIAIFVKPSAGPGSQPSRTHRIAGAAP